MSTQFVTSIEKGDNPYNVALTALQRAQQKLNKGNVDFAIIFSSPKYDLTQLCQHYVLKLIFS